MSLKPLSDDAMTCLGGYILGLKDAIEKDPDFRLSVSMEPIDEEAFDHEDERTLADFALENSTISVAKAITWAARDCSIDVTSMSFGFDEEILVEGELAISNAISEELRTKNQRILFFAAAANEGGNQPEMFPARHLHVISIRGTDDKGWLQRFNPPADYAGFKCFMTLGQDVPRASLSKDRGTDVCKSGTSVSRPIAAGIAAMLLSYARVYETELEKILHARDAWRSSELWTIAGMRKMFGMLSTDMLDRWYLSAIEFTSSSHELRLGMIALVVSGKAKG